MQNQLGVFVGSVVCLVSAGALAGSGTGEVSWGEATWDPVTGQGTVEVMWQCDVPLYGFQFNVPDDFLVVDVAPLECDEGWSLYNSDDLVLCFLIEQGAQIDAEGDELSFVGPIFANQDAQEIDIVADDVLVVGETLCPEDVYPAGSGDGAVDVNDVLAILGDWGSASSPYDVDGDGLIGVDDVLAVLNAWGLCG